jgi:hypothetical protein
MMRMAVVALLAGCSFVFVSGPPANAPPTASCTESRILPVLDAALATGLVVAGIAALATGTGCDSSQQDCTASNLGQGVAQDAGAGALVAGLVFTLSALRGFDATGTCRTLHARAAPGPR